MSRSKPSKYRHPSPTSSPDPLDFLQLRHTPSISSRTTTQYPSKRKRSSDENGDNGDVFAPLNNKNTSELGYSNASTATPNHSLGQTNLRQKDYVIMQPPPPVTPPRSLKQPTSPLKRQFSADTDNDDAVSPGNYYRKDEPVFYPRNQFSSPAIAARNVAPHHLLQSPRTPHAHIISPSVSQPSPMSARKLRKLMSSQAQIAALKRVSALQRDIFAADDMLDVSSSSMWKGDEDDEGNSVAKFYSVFTLFDNGKGTTKPLLAPSCSLSLVDIFQEVRSVGAIESIPTLLEEDWISTDNDHIILILKICQKTMESLEILIEPLIKSDVPDGGPSTSKQPKSKSSRGGGKRVTVSSSAVPPANSTSVSPKKMEEVVKNLLPLSKIAMLTIRAVLTILVSGRLSKQAYSENLITSLLKVVRLQLEHCILELINMSKESTISPEHIASSPLAKTPRPSAAANNLHTTLNEIITLGAMNLRLFSELITLEDMGEFVIIQAISTVKPLLDDHVSFFSASSSKEKSASVNSTPTTSATATKSSSVSTAQKQLVLSAFSLVQSAFSRHPQYRKLILDDVLDSVSKLSSSKHSKAAYKLHGGQYVHSVSALLLSLVQSAAVGSRRIIASAYDKLQNESVVGFYESNETPNEINILSSVAGELGSFVDSAYMCTSTIVRSFLSSLGHRDKTLFEHFVNDLLVMLDYPEYPAAGLMLFVLTKAMRMVIDDPSTSNESSTVRYSCIEPMGLIWKKLCARSANQAMFNLKSMIQITSENNSEALHEISDVKNKFVGLLVRTSSEDNPNQMAADFCLSMWSHELSQALNCVSKTLSLEDIGPDDKNKALIYQQSLLKAIKSCCSINEQASNLDLSPLEGKIPAFLHSLLLCHPLFDLKDSILTQVLDASNFHNANIRTRALKSMGSMADQDPTLFTQENFRDAIQKRLLDSSIAPRDAALELLGKHIVHNSELAIKYLPTVLDRKADTSLSVRKRVILLLKAMYPLVGDEGKVKIALTLVGRIADEDESVKGLTTLVINQLWFPTLVHQPANSDTPKNRKDRSVSMESGDGGAEVLLPSQVITMIRVAGQMRERLSPLEEVLRAIVEKHGGSSNKNVTSVFRTTTYELIDFLSDSEISETDIVNCVKLIYMITTVVAKVLSPVKATSLLPYLKSPTTAEEQAVSDYLLKIFRSYMDDSPKSAAKFAQNLEAALLPMINRPNMLPGSQSLQDLIACICAVIRNQTHDFKRLCEIYKSCDERLQNEIAKIEAGEINKVDPRPLPAFASITSLLCEHARFDELRAKNEDAAVEVNSICTTSITERAFDMMLKFYAFAREHKPMLTCHFLQSLGFIFRGSPTLMMRDASLEIMDNIFKHDTAESKINLLRVIAGFLSCQKLKDHATNLSGPDKSKMNVESLIGNTDMFADSGVASSVVQRYIDVIVEAAQSIQGHAQRAGIEIITFTVQQGLSHPMQLLSVLVSLETSENAFLSARAFSLHTVLQTKHSNLLNTRLTECIRDSWQYQIRMTDGVAHGCRGNPPSALLGRWFQLLKEKRQWRIDLLKSYVKFYDLGDSGISDISEVNLVRYVSENLANLEYRTTEEVMLVMKSILIMLESYALQIYHSLDDIFDGFGPEADGYIQGLEDAEEVEITNLLKGSLIMTLGFLVVEWLKLAYSINTAKIDSYVIGKKSSFGDRPIVKKEGIQMQFTDYYNTYPALNLSDDLECLWKHRKLFMDLVDRVLANHQDDAVDTDFNIHSTSSMM